MSPSCLFPFGSCRFPLRTVVTDEFYTKPVYSDRLFSFTVVMETLLLFKSDRSSWDKVKMLNEEAVKFRAKIANICILGTFVRHCC